MRFFLDWFNKLLYIIYNVFFDMVLYITMSHNLVVITILKIILLN